MFDMINTSGHGNGIGMKEGTQAEAYDIDGQSLFDVPSGNATAFYANGQYEKASTWRTPMLTRTLMFRMLPWTARAPPPQPIRRC
jgi:hypothetical protein